MDLRYPNSIDSVSMVDNCLTPRLYAYRQSLDPMAQHRSMALCILQQYHQKWFVGTLPTLLRQMNKRRHAAMTQNHSV